MNFEQLLDQIVGDSQNKAEALLTMWEQGQLTDDQFIEALAYLVDNSRARGAHGGLTVLRDYLETELQQPVVLNVQFPESSIDGLPKAVQTILNSDQETRMQVLRLVSGETLSAAHSAYESTLKQEPRVKGWKRGLEADACELCQWWSRDGKVWPKDHHMPTHTGCKCHQVPII